jgi:hypothetical protein
LPTTNNLVEVWHGASGADAKKNLTCVKCVDLIRREQNFTEDNWTKAIMGESECRKSSKAEIKKQENIKNIIQSYKRENIAIHLKGLALNMGDLKLNMQ